MPGFDGAGPRGEGPYSGGGFGRCGRARRGRQDEVLGVGRGGAPRGGGRGHCHGGGRSDREGWQGRNWDRPDDSRDRLRDMEEENRSLRRRIEELEARGG